MDDLRTTGIGQHAFYTNAGHDTDVMALLHEENEHAGVLSFPAYAPTLEELVRKIERFIISDGLEGYDAHLHMRSGIEPLSAAVEPHDVRIRDQRIGVGHIPILTLCLGIGNRRGRINSRLNDRYHPQCDIYSYSSKHVFQLLRCKSTKKN